MLLRAAKKDITQRYGLNSVELVTQIDRYFHFLNRIIHTAMISICMRHIGTGGSLYCTSIIVY